MSEPRKDTKSAFELGVPKTFRSRGMGISSLVLIFVSPAGITEGYCCCLIWEESVEELIED